PTPADVASWLADALRGLAYAHEAGVVHGDPQLHFVLVDDRGTASLMALGAAEIAATAGDGHAGRGLAVDARQLRDRRLVAERDVLAVGVLLHHLLSAEPPLGAGDTARVIERL